MTRPTYRGLRMQEVDPKTRSLQSRALKRTAAAFVRNVDDLHALLTLPLGLVNVALWEASRLHAASEAAWKAQVVGRAASTLKGKHSKQESLTIHMRAPSRNANRQMVDLAERILTGLLRHKTFEEVQFAVRALFYAAVSSSWGMFESVAKDSWIASLNARPDLLAHGALARNSSAGADDPLRNKQVSVNILARYGYNLRQRMGTLLAPKFDFTSISGIREAFSASFRNDVAIAKALASARLAELEVTRHLIVHRAGWIDEEYQRRMAQHGPLGKRLVLDGRRVGALSNAAIEASCELLKAIDHWMTRPRKK